MIQFGESTAFASVHRAVNELPVQNLQSLTYISRATDGLRERDIASIHEMASDNNERDGITGLLIYDGTTFMQIVEGSDTALVALIGRLESDRRHRAIDVVDQRNIDVRSFAGWSMRLVRLKGEDGVDLEQLAHELGPRVKPEIRAMLFEHAARMAEMA